MKSFFKKLGEKTSLILSGVVSVALLALSGIGLYFLTRQLDKKDSQLDKTIQKDGDLSDKAKVIQYDIKSLEAEKKVIEAARKQIKVDSDWYKEEK